jgi:hypothetical protein
MTAVNADYSVRDILWLRPFAAGASVISIPYSCCNPRRSGRHWSGL